MVSPSLNRRTIVSTCSAVWPELSLGQCAHIVTCYATETPNWMWIKKNKIIVNWKQQNKKKNFKMNSTVTYNNNGKALVMILICLKSYLTINRHYELSGCPSWPRSHSLSCLASGLRPLVTYLLTSLPSSSGAPASPSWWLTPEAVSLGWMTSVAPGPSPGLCAPAAGNL